MPRTRYLGWNTGHINALNQAHKIYRELFADSYIQQILGYLFENILKV